MSDGDLTTSTQEILFQYGISYRRLDHWTTQQYLSDDAKQTGNGQRRRYTPVEVTVLGRMLALVNAGLRPEVASKVARGETAAYNALADALESCVGTPEEELEDHHE